MKNDLRSIVIIAPHPDDELIGCFEILNKSDNKISIIYDGDTPSKRREEAVKIRELFPNISQQAFQMSLPSAYINTGNIFYFPDPVNEMHPLHRRWGSVGESLARGGYDVIFYSTIMNVPYIHEVSDSQKKEALLDRAYPSQKNMWLYEKKYVLFEGRIKWIF